MRRDGRYYDDFHGGNDKPVEGFEWTAGGQRIKVMRRFPGNVARGNRGHVVVADALNLMDTAHNLLTLGMHRYQEADRRLEVAERMEDSGDVGERLRLMAENTDLRREVLILTRERDKSVHHVRELEATVQTLEERPHRWAHGRGGSDGSSGISEPLPGAADGVTDAAGLLVRKTVREGLEAAEAQMKAEAAAKAKAEADNNPPPPPPPLATDPPPLGTGKGKSKRDISQDAPSSSRNTRAKPNQNGGMSDAAALLAGLAVSLTHPATDAVDE
jgi:hypothetical protein